VASRYAVYAAENNVYTKKMLKFAPLHLRSEGYWVTTKIQPVEVRKEIISAPFHLREASNKCNLNFHLPEKGTAKFIATKI